MTGGAGPEPARPHVPGCGPCRAGDSGRRGRHLLDGRSHPRLVVLTPGEFVRQMVPTREAG
jgi:hypothetical protein